MPSKQRSLLPGLTEKQRLSFLDELLRVRVILMEATAAEKARHKSALENVEVLQKQFDKILCSLAQEEDEIKGDEEKS